LEASVPETPVDLVDHCTHLAVLVLLPYLCHDQGRLHVDPCGMTIQPDPVHIHLDLSHIHCKIVLMPVDFDCIRRPEVNAASFHVVLVHDVLL
jgi:hypothetical protein